MPFLLSCVFIQEKAGRGKDRRWVCKLFTEPQIEFRSPSLNIPKSPENGQETLWQNIPLSLCWSHREWQVAILLAQAAASCSVKLKAQPCWCAVRVCTPPLLLSVCLTKSRKLHANAVLKTLLGSQSWKPVNWESREEHCSSLEARQGVGDGADSRVQVSWRAELPLNTRFLNQNRTETSYEGHCKQSSLDKTQLLGGLLILVRFEVCRAPLRSLTRLQAGAGGMGLPNCLHCRAHLGSKQTAQELCPFGFFSFSPYYRVTVHVTL